MGHDDNAVDPESDEGQQQEFEESAIGSEHGFMDLQVTSKADDKAAVSRKNMHIAAIIQEWLGRAAFG
jgi:hypothetical protein